MASYRQTDDRCFYDKIIFNARHVHRAFIWRLDVEWLRGNG